MNLLEQLWNLIPETIKNENTFLRVIVGSSGPEDIAYQESAAHAFIWYARKEFELNEMGVHSEVNTFPTYSGEARTESWKKQYGFVLEINVRPLVGFSNEGLEKVDYYPPDWEEEVTNE